MTVPLIPAFFLFDASPEALKVPLSMLIIFGSAKLLAELFERLNQPSIVGEILAGVLIGPSLLNWVAPNDLLMALSDIGVMFLLFKVGLEVNPAALFRMGGTAAVVACSGAAVSFIMGWGILTMWGRPGIEALFVGAAITSTSVGIGAQVLSARGLLQERASQTILAAAVIDDVLGLLALAVVSGMARGKVNALEIAFTIGLAIAFVVIVALWGNHAVGKVVPRLQHSMRLVEAEFTLAIILLLALSVLAVYVGVAAIVGAFFAGMALSGKVGQRVNDLSHGATELLVPFFLAGIGLRVNLSTFRDSSMIWLTAVLLLAAVASKCIGCGLGAIRLGKTDVIRVGVGMIPRGEVNMVVVQIGLGLGTIAPNIYGAVVFMAVATTLVAPPLIKFAFRGVEPKSLGMPEAISA